MKVSGSTTREMGKERCIGSVAMRNTLETGKITTNLDLVLTSGWKEELEITSSFVTAMLDIGSLA